MSEKDIFENMTNLEKETQWQLHTCIKNSHGDGKMFYRSLERQFLKKRSLSEKQMQCLKDGYERFS